jgi:peptidoglycan/xylan/chitin deacetylase (PgdA/CDA1 family)
MLEIAVRINRNALFGILALTSASGVMTGLPTEGAELHVRSAKAVPPGLFSYPYGATYLRVDYARRRPGYPYVGLYYGNYYAPDYAYSYAPPYWKYYDPLYPKYYGYSSSCYRSHPC